MHTYYDKDRGKQDKVNYAVSEREDRDNGEDDVNEDGRLQRNLLGCNCAALSCTGLYWNVLGCTGLYWAVLSCFGLCWALLGCTGLYWDVLGCTWLYWDVLGCTWLYWAVLGCIKL